MICLFYENKQLNILFTLYYIEAML